MRRLVQAILETYGYSPQAKETTEGSQSVFDFVSKYIVPAVAFGGLGYEVRDFSPVLASVSYIVALAVFFRGLWSWCNTRRMTALLLMAAGTATLAFTWYDYNWIRKEWTPSFLYFVPTRELIDCDRRAFFVNQSGFKGLHNVKIIIKDNRSGAVQETDDYREGIEPGSGNPDAPRYIWVKPSHPWDEDYTITVTGTNFRSVQETVLRSVSHDLQFAVQITVDRRRKPVVNCRDSLLPEAYSLGRGSLENCTTLMALDPGLLNKFRPEFYAFQGPNGNVSIIKMRQLPPASDLESQSEDRHLTEYQRVIMKAKLSKYRGTKLLVLYTGGPKTLRYATEFRDFFQSLGWTVVGPRPVPVGDERLVDLQMSVSKRYWNKPYPQAMSLLSSMEGLKHRQRYVYDDAIADDRIVLWVGPKSPADFKPDDCAPATVGPTAGQAHTCEVVAAVGAWCPFVPP